MRQIFRFVAGAIALLALLPLFSAGPTIAEVGSAQSKGRRVGAGVIWTRAKLPHHLMKVAVGFIVLALASWSGSVRAASPSFDCKLAVTVVEKEICADPLVATQDTQLAAAFKSAMTRRTPAERLVLLDIERRWLKDRNCSENRDTPSCFSYQYARQLDRVQSGADFTPLTADGCLPRESSPRALKCVRSSANGFAELADTLKHYEPSDTLVSCSQLLEITLTKYETGFGGVCRLRETRTSKYFEGLVCGDTGVGNFRLIPTGRAVASKTDLAHFIADNCAGG